MFARHTANQAYSTEALEATHTAGCLAQHLAILQHQNIHVTSAANRQNGGHSTLEVKQACAWLYKLIRHTSSSTSSLVLL